MIDTVIRDATPSDLPYVDSLRKKEGNALGFVPMKVYESIANKAPIDGRRRWTYMRLLVTVDESDLTGFCFVSYSGRFAHIFQIVVQEDARRWKRALLMSDTVEHDALRYGKFGVMCRVAFDLESNFFWRAIGYIPKEQVVSTWLNQRESKSKRPLWVYEKVVQRSMFAGAPSLAMAL